MIIGENLLEEELNDPVDMKIHLEDCDSYLHYFENGNRIDADGTERFIKNLRKALIKVWEEI
jgi:hypothetical protein